MRLGLALWPDRDVRELAELAVAAENAGFDDLWWPDHYDAREVSAVLTLCAARTTRIRLGTAVTSPLLRHLGILGSLFASLGEASDGRAVAGLGPRWLRGQDEPQGQHTEPHRGDARSGRHPPRAPCRRAGDDRRRAGLPCRGCSAHLRPAEPGADLPGGPGAKHAGAGRRDRGWSHHARSRCIHSGGGEAGRSMRPTRWPIGGRLRRRAHAGGCAVPGRRPGQGCVAGLDASTWSVANTRRRG